MSIEEEDLGPLTKVVESRSTLLLAIQTIVKKVESTIQEGDEDSSDGSFICFDSLSDDVDSEASDSEIFSDNSVSSIEDEESESDDDSDLEEESNVVASFLSKLRSSRQIVSNEILKQSLALNSTSPHNISEINKLTPTKRKTYDTCHSLLSPKRLRTNTLGGVAVHDTDYSESVHRFFNKVVSDHNKLVDFMSISDELEFKFVAAVSKPVNRRIERPLDSTLVINNMLSSLTLSPRRTVSTVIRSSQYESLAYIKPLNKNTALRKYQPTDMLENRVSHPTVISAGTSLSKSHVDNRSAFNSSIECVTVGQFNFEDSGFQSLSTSTRKEILWNSTKPHRPKSVSDNRTYHQIGNTPRKYDYKCNETNSTVNSPPKMKASSGEKHLLLHSPFDDTRSIPWGKSVYKNKETTHTPMQRSPLHSLSRDNYLLPPYRAPRSEPRTTDGVKSVYKNAGITQTTKKSNYLQSPSRDNGLWRRPDWDPLDARLISDISDASDETLRHAKFPLTNLSQSADNIKLLSPKNNPIFYRSPGCCSDNESKRITATAKKKSSPRSLFRDNELLSQSGGLVGPSTYGRIIYL